VEQVPPASPEPGHRTFIATVVFIDIVGYSERLVTQQVELKTRLNGLVAGVLEHVPVADRMMLDTGDGAALCFLGDPEDALFAASNLRASTAAIGPELALRIGINLGPLRIVKDVNGQPNMLGDGINVAQRVMSFAEPNQILVSRSYYEIVSRLSQEYTRLFQYLGIHRDKHVREHEVYVMTAGGVGATAPAAEQAEAAAAAGPPGRVESSEFVPMTGGHFEPAVLARVEAALAEGMGPLARVLVRKAAKTAPDLPALCQLLDVALSESQRAAFRRRLGNVGGAPPAPPPSPARPPATAPPAGAPPGRPLSPEVLAEAEERLAAHIGPVAKLLVKRAAKQASSSKDLYERLVAHIDDPQARRRFTAAIEELSGS
jgi:class 3 adenylate cyclase